jgi:1-acyl-sn-glycerol-3-phosphate acyltransferase
MWILKISAVVLYTAILGVPAMLSVLVSPRGALFFRIARLWCRWISATSGVRYRVTGSDGVDWNRNYLILSNHQSQFDIPALVLSIPLDVRMVAKQNLFLIPVFGWAIWLAGFIGINRSNRDKAIRSLDRAAEKIRGGLSVLIFVEGTRTPDGNLLPFKKGPFVLALKSGVPIVPVAVRGGRNVLPKGTLRIRPGTLEVVFGSPISTAGFSLDRKEILMDRVRQEIESLLQDDAGEAAAPFSIAGR